MKSDIFDKSDPRLTDAITRKAVFRELARDILWTDRAKRKYAQSQDTGGSIARVLAPAEN